MLSSYFKLALKILWRRKFFTFISLFGISFTLMILMVVSSVLNSEFGNHQPLTEKDKMIFLNRGNYQLLVEDTVWTKDTTYVNENMIVDSSFVVNENQRSQSTGRLGYYFLDNHLRDVENVEAYSFQSSGAIYDVFLNGTKLNITVNYAEAGYWDVYDFNFLEGVPYRAEHVEQQAPYVVISKELAEKYFGRTERVVGESISFDNRTFEVMGMVDNPKSKKSFYSSDVFAPLTHVPQSMLNSKRYMGGFEAVFKLKNENLIKSVKEDIVSISEKAPHLNPEQYNKFKATPATFGERYAGAILNSDEPRKSLNRLRLALIILLVLFVLLPTINLVNINVSRILERSSEIGVRKAFGANAQNILYQFIFENIIITLIGGIIGLALAFGLMYLINSTQFMPGTVLSFNGKVFFYSLVICLGFGLLSGILPAYKMSRTHIASSLKQNEL